MSGTGSEGGGGRFKPSMTTTALIVDSTALLTPELIERTGALVVPVTVTIDGVDYADGLDLDADQFFSLLATDPPPTVTTAQPSPGKFLQAFQTAARNGAQDVVAVLVGSAFSGTVDAARMAAANADLAVTCVDTGQASFGVGLCALAAAEALAAGATAAEAAEAAEALAPSLESVFIVQAIDLARASGRFDPTTLTPEADTGAAIPVLRYAGGDLTVLGEVSDVDAAVEVMAQAILAAGVPIRVASGLADRATLGVTEALERRLAASPLVTELIRYRVGPGVAANVGAGTAGVFVHPV